MREFFDYSGQDDDYEVEYDAPVFVFDDEDQDSGSDYGSSGGGSDATEKNEYVLEYVQDSKPSKASDRSKREKAAAAPEAAPAPAADTKSESKAASGGKAGGKSGGKSKKSRLQTPAEFEPEPAPPPPKPRGNTVDEDYDDFEPVFVFDEELTDEDDDGGAPPPPVSRESVGGRQSENAGGRRNDRESPASDEDDSENDFVFMPFLDMKDEPDEEEDGGKVKLSFSKVKTQKKEKEFVFMPFLNINDDAEEETESDTKKSFVSSKGTIIDEGLVLLPLESPDDIPEGEKSSDGGTSEEEDTGISLVGGEQAPMDHVPKPKKKKSSSSKGRSSSKKRPSGKRRDANDTPDEQFRAAMNNIDPEVLKAVRKDPIQMAALEQAVRIALVQQAAQAAVEKTTGRSFGYIGNYSPANTPGAIPGAVNGAVNGIMPGAGNGIMPGTMPASRSGTRKKKRPSQQRSSGGFGGSGIFSNITQDISAPSEFGIDAKEAARLKEAPAIQDMASSFTPPEQITAAPIPGYTPGPSVQQDPALAAMAAAAQADQPINPDSILPDVSQDPALASLKGSYGRPEDAQLPPGVGVPQNQSAASKINLSSPAAVRAAMRSRNSTDQILAQNAAKAKSSQAAEAANNSVESYDREAEESNRSGCLIWIIILFIVFFLGLLAVAVWPALSKELKYRDAYTALNSGNYSEAIAGFSALDDYKDSPQRNQEAAYMYADQLTQREDYEKALENFLSIDPAYSDTSERIAECRYALGSKLLADGKYAEAYDQLYLIPKYQNAGDLAIEANYKAAVELMDQEMYERAAKRFELFPDYQDSTEKYNYCQYTYAKALFDADQYDLAYKAYNSVGSYQDAPYYAAIAQYDAIVTGSGTYQPIDMRGALNTLAAYSNNEDAQTILQSHVYDIVKLEGDWQSESGELTLSFGFTENGNTLITHFDGEAEKAYENVFCDNGRIRSADEMTIFSINSFDPYTSVQPNTISLHVTATGANYEFYRR